MKHYLCLFAVFFALLVFSCGEVSGGFNIGGGEGYDATCDGIFYKSLEQFCFNNKIYSLCDGKEYDIAKEFCHSDGSVNLRCNGNMYNPVNDFCFDSKVYPKCGVGASAETYNPEELFCYENVLDTLCNGLEFNPKSYFCSDEDYKIHPFCQDERYNPKQEICSANVIYKICPSGNFSDSLSNCCSIPVPNSNCAEYQLCGKKNYDVKKEFCDGEIAYKMCGGKAYDNPSNKFCWPNDVAANGEAIEKCRVQTGVNDFGQPIYDYLSYDYDMQYCSGDGIKDRNLPPTCPGMNPATQFCCFGTIYNNSGPYFCDNEKLYPKCGTANNLIKYDPNIYGCFNDNTLYKKCSLSDVVGPCVDNTLKRCRQFGSGPNQTVDPLPGMTCDSETGAITGVSRSGGYPIAQIGTQVWMRKNIDVIITASSSSSSNNGSSCYEGSPDNCTTYGRLYDWSTAMSIASSFNTERYSFPSDVLWQGPCPEGFYIPTDEDWKKLMEYAGGASDAGGRLKAKSGWDNNGNGTDSYGFSALPGGYHNNVVGGGYFEKTTRAMWWSLTQPLSNNKRNASYWTIISADTELRDHNQDKALYKAYVRCLYY